MQLKFVNQKGQSLLEIILALAIFSIISASLVSVALGGFSTLEQGGEQTIAENLAQEGLEAVIAIRNRAWNELVYNTSSVSIFGESISWWDANYAYRTKITVSTGSEAPASGYNDYTVRLSELDTSSLILSGKMLPSCNDLRIVYYNGSSWEEINRHLIDCNTIATDIRFKLQADIPDNSLDDNYYIYYGNPGAAAPEVLTETNVYLWYDDAASDRSSNYIFGRCDAWHGTGYTAFSYNALNQSYDIDTGDNYTGCFRRAIGERDAYLEAEFYHSGCYPTNMSSGIIGRYILESGSGGSESASHYYATNRAQQAACGGGYGEDGDIVEGARNVVAVDGANPNAITVNQWRKMALSLNGINSTKASYWDSDTVSGFGPAGWPSISVHVSGTDSSDQEGAGDWGIIAAQDVVRIRNILIRKFTDPEPSLSLGTEEAFSILALSYWIFDGEDTIETIGDYTRTITFDNVCRDELNNITNCPGAYEDAHSQKVTVNVAWDVRPGVVNSVEFTQYLTNWDSSDWLEDFESDFDDGSYVNTEISATYGDADGAVILEEQ